MNYSQLFHWEFPMHCEPRPLGWLHAAPWRLLARVPGRVGRRAADRAHWAALICVLLPAPERTPEERAMQIAMRDAMKQLEDSIVRGRR